MEEVLDEVFGLGPLEPLLQDPTISDILVTTPRLVYVERNGKLFRTPVEFKDNAHLLRIIEKVVSRVGRRVDESSPLVDARLPDGSRVNAAIPPVAVDGPLLSIRRFGRSLMHGKDLVDPAHADRGHAGDAAGGGAGAAERADLRRHGRRQDHAAQRAFQLHSGRRAHRDHRRRRRAALAADARGAHGNAAGQRGRAGRHSHPRTGDQRPAYASRPHHRRRGPRRGSAGHAAGHEHGPRRLADHGALPTIRATPCRAWK